MKKAFVIVIIASVLFSLCNILQPIFLQKAIDAVIENDLRIIIINLIFFILSIIGILLLETVRKLKTGSYTAKRKQWLKSRLMHKVLHENVKQFNNENAQDYITSVNKEVEMVVESYYVQILEMTYCFIVLGASLCGLIYINYKLAVLVILTNTVPIVVASLLGKKVQIKKDLFVMSLKRLNVNIANLIHGFNLIKVNRVEKSYLDVFKKENQKTQNAEYNLEKTTSFVEMIIALFAYGGLISIVVVSIYMILNDNLTLGKFIAVLQISDYLSIPTNNISFQVNEIKSVKGIKKKLLSKATQQPSKDKIIPITELERIELNNVSFSYNDKSIFKNLIVTFEKGKKYLIVGDNGTGKSTLFKLICQFEQDYSGNILINGRDAKKLGEQYYGLIGMVFQTPFIFNDTFRNNICLHQPYDHDKLYSILTELDLKKLMPKGALDKVYVDTEDNLSGGEKQKIALARILLREKKFIMLDEACASIDNESSYVIERSLLERKDITLINIQHKLQKDLVAFYDEIITIGSDKVSIIKQ